MKIFSRIRGALAFTDTPTTILALLIYATILVSVMVTDELPKVPSFKKQRGLNNTQAFYDLQAIAARPHPYMVRANDDVRAHLLARVRAIAAAHPGRVHISDDLSSNASFTSSTHFGAGPGPGEGSYFEGTNIVVKVDGADAAYRDKEAVLFSAHYDSVATAPGATDDGMGVVSLLALVEYLAENRTPRTAVFNINNGEEDGLYGAHAFLEHPWAKIVTTFLNLEGAAAGGRPILFRSTSLAPARAFRGTHPHANVLCSDAFARGVIRSATDYSVYTLGNGSAASQMEGLDFAFYRGRSKYHTRADAVARTEGGRRALWAMLETARSTGVALLAGKEREGERGKPAVYFDLFGATTIVLPLSGVFIFNIVLLALGPLIVLALLLLVIAQARRARAAAGTPAPGIGGAKGLILALLGWARFWIMLALAAVFNALLSVAFIKFNRNVVYSHVPLVFTAYLALSYLALVVPLNLTHFRPAKHIPAPAARQQKLATLLETYLLTWALLLGATVAAGRLALGGLYWATVWHAASFVGAALGLAEAWVRARTGGGRSDVAARAGGGDVGAETHARPERLGGEDRLLVRGVRYEVGGTATGARAQADGREVRAYADGTNGDGGDGDGAREGAVLETDPTEITPLMYQHRSASPAPGAKAAAGKDGEKDEFGWWIVQMLVVVPPPVILIGEMVPIMFGSMPQTLGDGSPPATIYVGLALLAFLLVLPLAPFAHRLHRGLSVLVLLVFALTALTAWFAAPFSEAEPLKIFFRQTVELPSPLTLLDAPHAVTMLTGLPGILENKIIPELPSARGRNVSCHTDDLRGLSMQGCDWEGGLLPHPGRAHKHGHSVAIAATSPGSLSAASPATNTSDWLRYSVTRTGPTSVRIALQGVNSRACRIYFDSQPVSYFRVHGGAPGGQPAYPVPEAGYDTIKLWSRTWDREFVVDAGWEAVGEKESPVEGRVSCLWSEYESGAAGGSKFGGRIPALEEIVAFFPKWALVTKKIDGLVEAWVPFEL